MTYDDMLTHVLPFTPGCPELVAIDHLRKAGRRFCATTKAWAIEDELLTAKGITVYPLAVDDETERVRLQALRVDGCVYTTVDPLRGRSWVRRHCGGGRFGYLDNPTDLVIYPAPLDADRPIVMQLALQPSLASTEWPDDLAEFATDVAAGAISTLLLLPEAWKDTQMAGDQREIFKERCAAVAFKVARGFQSTTQRRQRFF